MGTKTPFLAFIFTLVLAGTASAAGPQQDHRSGRPAPGPAPAPASAPSRARVAAPPSGMTTTTVSPAPRAGRSAAIASATVASFPNRNYVPVGGSTGYQANQPYYTGPYYSLDSYIRWQYFYWAYYGSARYGDYRLHMWRYAHGQPALTADLVHGALGQSRQRAQSLLLTSRELAWLIDDYERGRLDRDTFRSSVKERVNSIRKVSKGLREDYFLSMIDPREEGDRDSYSKARTIAELKGMVTQLIEMAQNIRAGLLDFDREENLAQVVDVQYLEGPSFRTKTKNLDDLAKTIEKSAGRL